MGDGIETQVQVYGNHLTRNVSYGGVEIPTRIQAADFSEALANFEAARQSLAPRVRCYDDAIAFLQNPQFAGVPLSEMQDGLRDLLGYTAYLDLGASGATNRQTLISSLAERRSEDIAALEQAERRYEQELQVALQQNRERYQTQDEMARTVLKALRNTGLNMLDVDYIIAQVRDGFQPIDIGVPVERQNFNLAAGNF